MNTADMNDAEFAIHTFKLHRFDVWGTARQQWKRHYRVIRAYLSIR